MAAKKHLRDYGIGNFAIFPFLQLRTNETDLRQEYDYFINTNKICKNEL